MVQAMKKVTEISSELSNEERNLFSVAFKNVIGNRRNSWRVISSCEQIVAGENDESKMKIAQEYRLQIEKELRDNCNEVLVGLILICNKTNTKLRILLIC